ncbi:MmgE/PrpD family protein [Pigmentiphaga soli]|uniref:MmgE/PrpD family protein n=1 Tax=Pigmentiphaga soli TaxID=1007095 RepID=A0ABP8H1V5_9BURK
MTSSSDSSLAVTAQLAEFAATVDWNDVPAHVRGLMPVLLIDVFRAGAVGRGKPWTRSVDALFGGTTSALAATVFYSGRRADPARAAFINGTACGSLDWDDSHVAAIIHPGICIWPAALAVAEATGASGRELLAAVLAGYEVAIRIGMSIQPEHSLRGFQGTPTCGTFGAAAACARLLKLSPEGVRDALGIASSFSCGLSQFFVSGSDIKRIHAGKAAANGVEAALLAHAGLTGPHDAIEGSQGFGRAFSDRFDPATAVKDLGTGFRTEWISLKPHVGSVRMQAAIEAAIWLAQDGVRFDDVASVEIGVHRAMIGKLTASRPVDVQQAQLSTPFAVALALALTPGRSGPVTLTIDDYEGNFGDPRIADLSARTTCSADAEVERLTTAESVAARVTCTLRDGSRREHFIASPKGCPQNPLTVDEISQRFVAIAEAGFDRAAIDAWLAAARGLERLDSVAPLLALRAGEGEKR